MLYYSQKHKITIAKYGLQIDTIKNGSIKGVCANDIYSNYIPGAIVQQINTAISYSNYNQAYNNFRNYSIAATGLAQKIGGYNTGQLITNVYDSFTERLYGYILLNEIGTYQFYINSLDDRFALKIGNNSGCITGCGTGTLFTLNNTKAQYLEYDSYWTQDGGSAFYNLQYRTPSNSSYTNLTLDKLYYKQKDL